jgi:hypothetical protein
MSQVRRVRMCIEEALYQAFLSQSVDLTNTSLAYKPFLDFSLSVAIFYDCRLLLWEHLDAVHSNIF